MGADVREVAEELASGEVPVWKHPEWREELPWLVQGTTGTGADDGFDLGLFGGVPVGRAVDRWRRLRQAVDMPAVVHARQVHGADIRHHADALPAGLVVMEGFDAHVSGVPGLLMTVSVADCVPVFLVDERRRSVGLAHAGWRGAAAGIVERVIERMASVFATRAADLRVHFGPSICGECYEVGPEVHAAVTPGVPPPSEPTPIDLRAALAARVGAMGVDPRRTTVSAHCTRCGPGGFFSHRGGSAGRQMGVAGVRG